MRDRKENPWDFFWVNGEKVRLDQGLEVWNPAKNRRIGFVPKAGEEWTRRAIDAASDAFSAWSKRPAQERSAYLQGWAQRLLQHRDELAELLSEEQGKPLAEAKGEIEGCALFIQWYAEEGKRVYGEVVPGFRASQRIMVWRQPVGVVGMITPWNFPAAMIARKAAPAIAAGCTVVIKPSGQTPMIAIALLQHLMDTGLPNGVANLITGDSEEIGRVLLSDSRVRKISFTGSTDVGKKLMAQAANQVKRVSLELGGNAPVIVFPDANLEHAADAIVGNKFENCGQVCNGINVIYAHRTIAQELTKQIVSRVASLKVGEGNAPGVDIGPMIDGKAVARVEELVEDALKKGAKILCGGHRLREMGYKEGHFYAPTVLSEVNPSMRVVQEEIFGPVAPIIVFDEEEDVIFQCNQSPYGLAAYFFTRNLARVYRVGEQLEFGMVAVNGTSLSVPQAPFGGIKESGMGREGGHYGIEEFLELKYVTVTIDE